jgi:hypothetical protein
MPIIKEAVCDICKKRESLDIAVSGYGFKEKWFIITFNEVICSLECFMNRAVINE